MYGLELRSAIATKAANLKVHDKTACDGRPDDIYIVSKGLQDFACTIQSNSATIYVVAIVWTESII